MLSIAVSVVLVLYLSTAGLATGQIGLLLTLTLVGDAVIRRQHAAGQGVGTGYPRSLRVLSREVNRQVDWIFTNHAGDVQGWIRRFQRPGG